MFFKTLKEKLKQAERENASLKRKQYRVGDTVYINGGKRDPLQPYFLRESINNGYCYYVTITKEEPYNLFTHSAVHIDQITHNKPSTCKACGSQIIEEE